MNKNLYSVNEIFTDEIPYEFGTIMGLILTKKIIMKKINNNHVDYLNWWIENEFEDIIFSEIMNYPHYVKKYNYMLKDEFCFRRYLEPFTDGFRETSSLCIQRNSK